MGDFQFSLTSNRVRRQSRYRLRLDPWVEWELFRRRMEVVLRPVRIRTALLNLPISQYQPPNPLDPRNAPSMPEPESPFPRGTGPSTPRAGTDRDIMRAVTSLPAVDRSIERIASEAQKRVQRDWDRMSTGDRVALISTGATMAGLAAFGVAASPSGRSFALDLAGNTDLQIPGVPYVGGRFNTGGEGNETRLESLSLRLNDLPIQAIPGLTVHVHLDFSNDGPRLDRFFLNLDVLRLIRSIQEER